MNIVILSRNAALYSTASLTQAADKRGHTVRVVDHLLCDLVIEKDLLQVIYYNQPIEHVDVIIPRIGSSATTYGAAIIRQFEAKGVYSTLNPEGLLKARDKLSCLQYLSQKGIDVPKTVIINNQLMIKEMVSKIEGEKKIVKLISGTHGLGVILSENDQNAEAIIEAFQKVRQKALIQEFIEESNGSDIRLIVVGDKVVACMCRQAQEGEFRSNLHRGGSSFEVKPTEEEVRIALQSAKVLGLEVAGVDMLRSARGPLILEVNASPGLEGIEGTTGVDVAGKIIELAERNAKASWRK